MILISVIKIRYYTEDTLLVPTTEEKNNDLYVSFVESDFSVLSLSVQYPKMFYMVNGHCVVPNVIERNLQKDADRITLILHASFNKLNNSIKNQTANWEGPISLAVVFPPEYDINSEEVLCSIKFVIILFLTFIIIPF